MSSYGYQSDHVNLIADNLRDRYKSGFPILKELIQNADDARAHRLVFGLHTGFKGQSAHVLLQGPGLWIFNDGNFKKEDERAIRSFGLNSKAGESGSIGKFGLGMKSVFHLCEAFFYVAFDGQRHFDVLMNPWRDPDGEDLFHRAWDQVATQEFDALRSVVKNERLDEGCNSWFLMWIPLRRRDHVPQKDGKPYGGIVDKYPGDGETNEMQFLSDGRLSRKIRSVVPLLRCLESIELASTEQIPGFKVQISFDDGVQRVDHSSADLVSTGSVSDGAGSRGKLRFRIQQNTLVEKLPFSQFKQLNVWPKTGRLNSEGIREPVPDKSEAEGAVLVSGAPADGDEAKLDINWAVFLPIEEGLSYECRLDKSLQHYRIVLHGQFFVDAGRRGIAGSGHLADRLVKPSPDLDDADLHTGWNQSVAQQVILPQLLPTLAQFANDHLNDRETEELARAILNARAKSSAAGVGKGFWETFRDFICNEQAWVRLITTDGLKWSHQKITQNSRLLKVPPPPRNDLERPWKVLPRMKQLVEAGCLLLDEEAPSLVGAVSNWDAETLLPVLDGVDYEQACSETGMAYLVSFLKLEQRRYVNDGDVQRKLIALLRDMLRREPLQTFRSIRSTFQELASLVRADYRFALGTKRIDAVTRLDDITLKLLICSDIDKLLLPMDLDPEKDDASKGQPDQKEIRSLLKTIDQEISRLIDVEGPGSSEKVENLLRSVQSMLNLLGDKKDERGQAIRVSRTLRVLTATCARNNRSHAVSLDELQQAHLKGLLFKQDGFGAGAYRVAAALANLLPFEQIWVVGAELAGWVAQLGDQNTLPVPSATDTTAAYTALGKRGRPLTLADLNVRSRFIRNISPSAIKGDDLIRGMRYVLHGKNEHHDDVDATLWINADRADEVWIKLKCMIEPDSWNVVDSNLAGAVRPDDWGKLGIFKVGPDEVIAHMGERCSFDRIDAAQFHEEEIVRILNRIADEKLWKSIPLHRDAKDDFGPIGEDCYFDPDGIANPILLSGVRIITLSDDQKLREKQKQWVPHWTHETTIGQALTQAAPETHWELILEAVGNVDSHILKKNYALKSASWLPLSTSGSISPEDVIDLEPLAAEIDRLASECGYCYAGILALSQEVQQHAKFLNLKPLFASGKSALERLGQLMVEAGEYSVGDVLLPENIDSLIEPLAGLSTLPAWLIVKTAIDAVGHDRNTDVTEYLLKEIRQPLSVKKLIEILNEISAQDNRKQHAVFNLYLKQLAQFSDDLSDALTKIKLLGRDGSWKPASWLCVGVQGVIKSSVLDDEQARILSGFIEGNAAKHRGQEGQNFSTSAGDEVALSLGKEKAQAILINYFKPWRELMPSGPVGALFALLGPSFRSLAEEWLKPHSFDYFADQLSWSEPGSRDSPIWDYRRREHPKLEALEMLDFIPEISNSKEIKVVSLLGKLISVPVDDDFDSLLVGNLTWAGTRGSRALFRMRLRELPNPERSDKNALSNLLRKTCQCVLRDAYNQREVKLGQLWEALEKSNQLELTVARGLILDRLPYDLRNLKSVKKNIELSKWLDSFKKLETSRAEKREAKQTTEHVEKDIGEAKTILSYLMTSDSTVQESVLNGIRKRVEQNQYRVSSIAFELLQNADDAVAELQSLMRDDATPVHSSHQVGRFVMETAGANVRFMHWGRPINYMGHGKARNESHGEDLQRMLILAASDKDETTGLTGKFGLGFKSVLLATDMPCLLSGDLKAKIVGGCLPVPWPDANEAIDALQRHRLPDAPGLRGTVVEFKVNAIEKQSQVVDRFSALAGLQCVFSKEIRFIQINETGHKWQPKLLVDDLPNVEIGVVQLPSKGGVSASRLLNFRIEDACLALRVDSRGFVRFQDDAEYAPPGIWVTAPTREPAASGVILNSQFELDTGRGGLPHGESAVSNLIRADRLGEVTAALVLQAMRRTRGNWDDARSQLKLAKDVTPPEFWATFWAQIPVRKKDEDDGEANRLLSRFGHRLFERFVAIADEIPNGLPGPLSAFIKASSVCLALNSRWEKFYEPLSKWSEFVGRFPISGWISEGVAAQLKATSSSGDLQIHDISVKLLLDTVPQSRCSAELMATLSGLLIELSPEEKELVRVRMDDFLFQAKDGSWKPGRQLVKAGVEFDRQCLPFAPPTSILNSSYEGFGLAIDQQYAAFERPQGEVLANWILATSPDAHEGRVAGLRLLLRNPDVQFWIRIKIEGSWIAGLEHTSSYLTDFSIPEKNQLLVMFNPQPVWSQPDSEEPSNVLLDRDEALAAISNWWRESGGEHLKKFDREFWPAGIPRQFNSTSDHRASWMTLFAIGLMQRHGRVRDQQNRGFIDKMQTKGFWDVFCITDPREEGQAWLNVLKEYGEQQIEDEQYSMWMDSFPRLYRIARWFDVYTHAFQSLDYRDRSQIVGFLSVSADPVLSGSGIHAPSIRDSLRLGQHVVIRELLRCGALQSETARALAFKPGYSVKQLLSLIGFDDLAGDDVRSEQIYDVLKGSLGEDATFDGAYDIPLLILARDPDLQQQILGNVASYEGEFDGE